MRVLRVLSLAAFIAAVFVLAAPAAAGCPAADPSCHLAPPQSQQVNPFPITGGVRVTSLEDSGALLVTDFTSPLSLGAGSPVAAEPMFIQPVSLPTNSNAPDFPTLDVRQRYQDPSDFSCGVQALGMALDGLGSPGPASPALLDFLQGEHMMYDFGTGVEELAFAAQSFGYPNSLPFHDGSLALLQSELAAGRPIVVSLGHEEAEGLSDSRSPGHFVTVTGISPDGDWIAYNDPTLGKVVVPMDKFMSQWALQGYSGVTVGPSAAAVSSTDAPEPNPINASPWLLFAAGVMALISNAGLGLRRQGIGGMIAEGSGVGGSKAAPKPAPKPASSSSSKKKEKEKKSKPKDAPPAVSRAEAAFEAAPPPPPEPPVPHGVARAEEAFELPPEPQRPSGLVGNSDTAAAELLVCTVPADPAWVGYPTLEDGQTFTQEGGTYVGNNPFVVGPSYGPSTGIAGIPGLVLRAVSLANSLLGPYAYGEYLKSQKPNVTARLSYSQSAHGTLIQSVAVENTSGQPLKESVRVIGSSGSDYTSSGSWLEGQDTLLGYTAQEGERAMTGLGSFGPVETVTLRVGIVASFNDPPLFGIIEFQIPAPTDGPDAKQQPHQYGDGSGDLQ